ncbi:restriction endonuclease [Nakamurella sp. A5-74]|uniref:Restriction endonuclease n=1 Tax=Nakamurella sp. A5-74 TaxID=3158264 RepID=A0AAU8DQV1_9ACTN
MESGIARIHAEVAAGLLETSCAGARVLRAGCHRLVGGDGLRRRRPAGHPHSTLDDGIIDGIIDQEVLGLSRVYVQAKSCALGTGRPEIQGFVGALHGQQANQGVFITTGRFSSGATNYAEGVATRVVLIGGARLARLMIRHGVGVQVRQTCSVVEIDEDFIE